MPDMNAHTAKRPLALLLPMMIVVALMAAALGFAQSANAVSATYDNPKDLNSEDIVITLSRDSYNFNGLLHKPTVKVQVQKLVPPPEPEPDPDPVDPGESDDLATTLEDGEGDNPEVDPADPIEPVYRYITLKKGTNYLVYYSKCKYPGTATVTVKGIGKYKGTVKLYFKINTAVKYVNQKSLGYPYGCEMVNAYALMKGQGIDVSGFFKYVKKYYPSYYKGAAGGNVIGTAKQTASFSNGYLKMINSYSKFHVYAKKGYSVRTLVNDANKGYPCLAIVSDKKYNEHCVSIVGGTTKRVAVMDSLRGYKVYSMTTFKKMYKKWGYQSVRISR